MVSLFVCHFLAHPAPSEAAKKDEKKEVPFQNITDCPNLPGCAALIILDETKLNNDQNYTGFTRRQIIKVFTQKGVQENSDDSIPYWGKIEKLKYITAKTILPDGTEIPVTEEHIRTEVAKIGRRKIKTEKISFPGVVPGAILAWSYRINLDSYVYQMDDTWEIQKKLPVLKSRYLLKHGPYEYDWIQAGAEKVDIEIEKKSSREIQFTAYNVPPLPEEPFTLSDQAIRARMYFFLSEIGRYHFEIGFAADPDSVIEEGEYDWLAPYAAWVAKTSGEFIEKTSGIPQKVKEFISPMDSEDEKIRKIYDFVQRDIGREEKRLSETEKAKVREARNIAEVLRRGYGNQWERNLLFLTLAKEAGFRVTLLVISSRENGPLNLDIPDPTVFDSFATAIKTSKGWKTYDPATKYLPLGMVSAEKEGKGNNAFMLVPGNYGKRFREGIDYRKFRYRNRILEYYAPYSNVEIEFTSSRKNVFTKEATVTIGPEDVAEVAITEGGTGHADISYRNQFELLDEAERKEKLQEIIQEMYPHANFHGARFENLSSHEENARIVCRLQATGLVTRVGDRLIVTPSIFHANSPNPFTKETRITPIYFPFAHQVVEKISFIVPEGYRVDELPSPVTIGEKPLNVRMSYTRIANGFQLNRILEINTALFPAEEYQPLKSIFERIWEVDRQVVVLKKTGL